ncbi:uncharacterized protein LOC128669288 [Plodia interpunctella]|uniref:uncharacterized protein LOC128669288 n=1 Tax=Plodia interpunctella TaxID=58824 RepID=UPI002368DE52|nr:uncharacterized protein LOC128669288 [Plodia interpunctella]
MSREGKMRPRSPTFRRGRPVPRLFNFTPHEEDEMTTSNSELKPVEEETKTEISEEAQEHCEPCEPCEAVDQADAFKSEFERFVEISKYFSSPLRKSASYICENRLVSYPNPFAIHYKRGGVTTQHIKFCNLTLEPVYIKLYKLIPDLEQLKYINLSFSRCKRIPPGLSFNLGFVYDDVNEKPPCNAKMIFVASRKTTTPCYQICEIELEIEAQKIRLVTI